MPWSYESLYHDVMKNRLASYIVAEADGVNSAGMSVSWKIVDEDILPMSRSHRTIAAGISRAMLEALIARCGQTESQVIRWRSASATNRRLKLYEGSALRPRDFAKRLL